MRLVVLHDGSDLAEWRSRSRTLLAENVLPSDVQWQVGDEAGLLPTEIPASEPSSTQRQTAPIGSVPREFLNLANTVLAHADARRHAVLYRLLWRLIHGERHLLNIAT